MYSPLFLPHVAAAMAEQVAEYDGDIELAWVLIGWPVFTAARLIGRGNNAQVAWCRHDVQAGESLGHSHPRYRYVQKLYPSERDIAVAQDCGSLGVGCVIVEWDLSRAFVMRPPLAVQLPEATGPRPKVWSFGRWTLIQTPRR
jgi:hypothetical protein